MSRTMWSPVKSHVPDSLIAVAAEPVDGLRVEVLFHEAVGQDVAPGYPEASSGELREAPRRHADGEQQEGPPQAIGEELGVPRRQRAHEVLPGGQLGWRYLSNATLRQDVSTGCWLRCSTEIYGSTRRKYPEAYGSFQKNAI